MTRTPNVDNIRTWLGDLESGAYEQVRGQAVRRFEGSDRYCAEGVACLGAARDGVLRVFVSEVSGQPRFANRDDVDNPYVVTEDVSDWLGFDLLNEEIDLLRLPRPIHDRIRAARGYEDNAVAEKVWILNDNGASFADIAAAVRCHLGLDLHLVPGTPEHAEYQAHIDAQLDAWAQDDANWRAAVAA